MTRLSVAVPFCDDFEEALALLDQARRQLPDAESAQSILIECILSNERRNIRRSSVPAHVTVLPSDSVGGLPRAKNLALRESTGDLVLFLFPGVVPGPGAVERLLLQMNEHPDWGGVAGRWNNEQGQAEKGYNVRRFPTFTALLWDLLLINKLVPSNRVTRSYKMHDFDHGSLCEAEHVNDCAFMARRGLLSDLGGFDESYSFGWFDQLEMCRKMRQRGCPVYYDPASVFLSTGRQPLVNRMLAERYVDFYRDESRFVRREFGCRRWHIFRVTLAAGMVMRLAFAGMLPGKTRSRALQRYRSYVSDGYIQGMRASYVALLKSLFAPASREVGN